MVIRLLQQGQDEESEVVDEACAPPPVLPLRCRQPQRTANRRWSSAATPKTTASSSAATT